MVQISVKLNSDKFKDIIDYIMEQAPFNSISDAVGFCVWYMFRFDTEPIMDKMTRLDLLAQCQCKSKDKMVISILKEYRDYLNHDNTKELTNHSNQGER